MRKPLANNRIRASEVRVIDEKGEQLGVFSLKEALQKAEERNLDLVQITGKVSPPVCKIIDLGKYIYSLEKKQRQTKKSSGGDLKEIRLGFNISPHDLETKAKLAEKFLKRGDKVRIVMVLRGREKALSGFANKKINQFIQVLEEKVPLQTEQSLKRMGGRLIMIIMKK